MTKKNILEDQFESEVDEVEAVARKREKKKKSKEEKSRDRRVVFWVLVLVVASTFLFWFKAVLDGKNIKTQVIEGDVDEVQGGGEKENEFVVKYKI